MREIKFEYVVVFDSGEIKRTVKTLEQIEKSGEFSSFGQAIANIGNGVKKVHRRQYTGLLDKNGVEIYEGDILKHLGKDNIAVEFLYGEYNFMDYHEIEVIGNIYENKDLLS